MEGTLNDTQIQVLSGVYVGCLSLSLIGSLSVLLVSIVKWRHLQQQSVPLVQLAIADFLSSFILLLSCCMNFLEPGTHHFLGNVVVCMHSLPLSLMFYCVSSLLVLVYAWKSKQAVEGWRERPANSAESHPDCGGGVVSVPAVYVAVWLLPIVYYTVYTLTDVLTPSPIFPPSSDVPHANKYCSSCILFLHVWQGSCASDDKVHEILMRISVCLCVMLVLVCCMVMYCHIVRWHRKYEEDGLFPVEGDGHCRRRLRGAFSSARYMVLVIIFCWTPALLLIVLSMMTRIPQQSLFPLYILQAGTVSLQGFLNSIFYAWRRENFREAVLGERMPLIQSPLPYFDESLRAPFSS